MIRPRKPFWFVFLPLTLMAGYLALVYELSLIYVTFSLLGTLLVLGVVLSILGLRGLHAAREHPHEVVAGSPFEVTLTLENRTTASSSMFFLVEDALQRDHHAKPRATAVLSLEPAEQATFSYRARIDRRGRHAFGEVRCVSRFPFGAWERRARLPAESSLLVLPRVGRLARDLVREEAVHATEQPVPVRGGMGEFHGVRPFAPGDSPRWIHWATSARKGGTWVREFEREIDRRLIVALDPALKSERAITMCATLADHYLKRGWRVALAAPGAWVPFGADLRLILRALAAAEPGGPARVDPQQARGALVAIVGASFPGLAGTTIDPADPALVEEKPDEL